MVFFFFSFVVVVVFLGEHIWRLGRHLTSHHVRFDQACLAQLEIKIYVVGVCAAHTPPWHAHVAVCLVFTDFSFGKQRNGASPDGMVAIVTE